MSLSMIRHLTAVLVGNGDTAPEHAAETIDA